MRTLIASKSIATCARRALPLAFLAFAACKALPPVAPPEPQLRMIESAPLSLPADCSASGSYVIDFTITPAGHTQDIRAAQGPACLQEALSAWVASFRYQPISRAKPAAIEWLMVTAKREDSTG